MTTLKRKKKNENDNIAVSPKTVTNCNCVTNDYGILTDNMATLPIVDKKWENRLGWFEHGELFYKNNFYGFNFFFLIFLKTNIFVKIMSFSRVW